MDTKEIKKGITEIIYTRVGNIEEDAADKIIEFLRSQGLVRKKAERECICGGVSSYINSEKVTCPFCYGSKKFIEVEEI